MDPNAAQSALDAFSALKDAQSRREAYQGMLCSLNSQEIRDIKSILQKVTLQCDILGRLPLDLVCLVVRYLDVRDIFLQRRTSKTWNELLCSPVVLQSIIRAITGQCPSSKSVADLDFILKRRWRIEHWKPVTVAKIHTDHLSDSMKVSRIVYCKGTLAWLRSMDDDENMEHLFVVSLRTGDIKCFTTENRERMERLKLSATLAAATSSRGYCHVWDIQTGEHKSFRLPSNNYSHSVINGNYLILEYPDELVHFCFTTGVTRIVKVDPDVFALSLHASDGHFFVAHLEKTDCVETTAHQSLSFDERQMVCQLIIKRVFIQGNEFHHSVTQYNLLSFIPPSMRKGPVIDFSIKRQRDSSIRRVSFVPGQSCSEIVMLFKRSVNHITDIRKLVFSLECDGTVKALFEPSTFANLNHSDYVDQRLMYSSKFENLLIGFETPLLFSMPPGTAAYDLEIFQTTYDGPEFSQGDDDFVTFGKRSDLLIGSFDEAWKPLGVIVETQALPVSNLTNIPRIYQFG